MLQDSEDGVPMLLTIVCHSMMLLDDMPSSSDVPDGVLLDMPYVEYA